MDRDSETAAGWPTGHSMIVQLREALGLFAGAMPISPQRAWEDALAEVRRVHARVRNETVVGYRWRRPDGDPVLLPAEEIDILTCTNSG